MAPNSTAASAPAAPAASHPGPLFGRAALAILGSMLFLIVALTAVLVQTTWAAPDASMIEAPALTDEPGTFAQR